MSLSKRRLQRRLYQHARKLLLCLRGRFSACGRRKDLHLEKQLEVSSHATSLLRRGIKLDLSTLGCPFVYRFLINVLFSHFNVIYKKVKKWNIYFQSLVRLFLLALKHACIHGNSKVKQENNAFELYDKQERVKYLKFTYR